MRRAKHKVGASGRRVNTQHSYLSSLLRVLPTAQQLLAKKYYQPIIEEDERRQADMITYSLRGQLIGPKGLRETISTYTIQEHLTSYYPKNSLKPVFFMQKSDLKPRMAVGAAFKIVRQSHRMKQAYYKNKHLHKKQPSKSTAISSKRSLPVLNVVHCNHLNQSTELSRLTRCLKSALNKYDGNKAYRVFVSEMEKRGMEPQQKSEGMIKFILNLQKDFSSIYQQKDKQLSKEMIYGLSELKKQSQKCNSGYQKGQIKRFGQAFILKSLDFGRRNKPNDQIRGLSTSKNSKKSISYRGKKGNGVSNNTNSRTPDARPSSKSRGRKKLFLRPPDKSNRAVDTQKLYFDEQKAEINKAIGIQDGVKLRRKVVKR